MHLSQSFTKSLSCAALVAASALAGVPAAWAATVEGQLDPHFSGDGRAVVQFHEPGPGPIYLLLNSVARAVAVQSDGKIVVAGDTNQGNGSIALARFNVDGSPDTSFGTQGERLFSFGTATLHVRAMVIQPDGKIVVAGSYQNSGEDQDFLAIRFNADGVNADLGFGTFGMSITDFAGYNDLATSMALGSDGSLYLTGYETSVAGDKDFGLVKLQANGVVDTNFGTQGKVGVFFDQGGSTVNNNDTAYGVALQSDGKVVVAGYVSLSSSESEFGLMRVNGSTGALDTGFGNMPSRPGRSVAQYGSSCRDYAAALKINEIDSVSFRRIYTAGTTCLGQSFSTGVVAAFDDDGTLDTSFGSPQQNGWYYQNINLDINYSRKNFTTMVLQNPKDSWAYQLFKPIAAGFGASNQYNNNYDMLLARMNFNGSPDTTFGSGGQQAVFFNYAGGIGDDYAYASTMDGNGYLLLVGSRQRNSSGATDFAIARLLVSDSIFHDGFDGHVL